MLAALIAVTLAASTGTMANVERHSLAGNDLAVLRELQTLPPIDRASPRAALLRESAATRLTAEAQALLHDDAAIGAIARAVIVLAASHAPATRAEAEVILASADAALTAYPSARRYAAFLRSVVLGVPVAVARPLHQPWLVIASNPRCTDRRNALIAKLPAGGSVIGQLRFTNERCDGDGWYADVEIRVGDVASWATFNAARPSASVALRMAMMRAVGQHAAAQISRGRLRLAQARVLEAEEALLSAALSIPVRPRELEQLLVERHGIAVPMLGAVGSSPRFTTVPPDRRRAVVRRRRPAIADLAPRLVLPPPPIVAPPDGLTPGR